MLRDFYLLRVYVLLVTISQQFSDDDFVCLCYCFAFFVS